MEDKKPKIRFFKNLHYFCNAICCYWINEIHIDEKWRNHPLLNHIIDHELKHYRIVQRILNSNSALKKGALILYNNVWDLYDGLRLDFKRIYLYLKRV